MQNPPLTHDTPVNGTEGVLFVVHAVPFHCVTRLLPTAVQSDVVTQETLLTKPGESADAVQLVPSHS
jgi:hypothetical protein